MTATRNYQTEVVVADAKTLLVVGEPTSENLLRMKAESASVCIVDGPRKLDGIAREMSILELTDVEEKGTTDYYELHGFRGMTWITDYHVVVYTGSMDVIHPDDALLSKIEQIRLNAYMED